MQNRSKIFAVTTLVILAAVAARAAEPSVPFTLSEQEQATLDETLLKWQEASAKISASSCSYTCWFYDLTFAPKKHDYLQSRRKGELRFRAPDHFSFRETKRETFHGQSGKLLTSNESLDHVTRDGTNIYLLNSTGKYYCAPRNIDMGWLGRAILSAVYEDGPLLLVRPFDAKSRKDTCWIREITPANDASQHIWLELWPKDFQKTTASQKTTVVLSRTTFAPFALQIIQPGGNDKIEYVFENWKLNAEASGNDADFTPTAVEKN